MFGGIQRCSYRGIVEHEKIPIGGTRGGEIQTTDPKFANIVEFVALLEKYDWDVDNLLEATTLGKERKHYGKWGRLYEKEIKAEINW